MPQISRRQFEVISAALSARKSVVGLNKSWQWVHEHLGLGRVVGKTLYLSPEDQKALRRTLQVDTGVDPLSSDIDYSSRTEAARDVINEKWASDSIGRGGVYLTRVGRSIQTCRGDCILPGGIPAWMNYQDVVLDPSDIIVVIENLEAFLHWPEFNLPAELRSAIALYRGHDARTCGSYEWLKGLSENQAIVAFTDFDPAGLRIALDTPKVSGWLVPDDPKSAMASNLGLFTQQSRYLAGLLIETHECWKPWLQAMLNGNVAITQERMCAHQVPLRMLPR